MHTTSSEAVRFVETLSGFTTVLAIKVYRMALDGLPAVPVLPCLDHEAMLHEGIAAHAAAYVQDASANLHEVVYIPRDKRLDVEVASTIGECTDASKAMFVAALKERFPGYSVGLLAPSRIRGEYRVMNACRAQVSLRDVLTGADLDTTQAAIERLRTISALMEKQSRSASWGARTVMTPLIAVAGFLSYAVLSRLGRTLAPATISFIGYVVITLVGGLFLYWGVKAVQLTEMANRVWKRSAEYNLILGERRRLSKARR